METIEIPELSQWKCYMFGNNPKTNTGLCYQPIKGEEPNSFVRFMMKICFACTWEKSTEQRNKK